MEKIYINYAKKFEGHKPGRENIENDPTIVRYIISFLLAVNTFQIIIFFKYFCECHFSKSKITNKNVRSSIR